MGAGAESKCVHQGGTVPKTIMSQDFLEAVWAAQAESQISASWHPSCMACKQNAAHPHALTVLLKPYATHAAPAKMPQLLRSTLYRKALPGARLRPEHQDISEWVPAHPH